MKKIYCIICGNHKKLKNSKVSYIFKKTLVLSIISGKCRRKNEKQFKLIN